MGLGRARARWARGRRHPSPAFPGCRALDGLRGARNPASNRLGSNHATTLHMGSLIWLGLTAVFVVGVVLTGHTPKGGKPVARTRLMSTARSMLIVGAVAFGALGLWGALRR